MVVYQLSKTFMSMFTSMFKVNVHVPGRTAVKMICFNPLASRESHVSLPLWQHSHEHVRCIHLIMC